MMDLVDTHCHIQSVGLAVGGEHSTREKWAKLPDLTGDKVVQDAADQGVNRLICVGCDLEDSKLAVEFVKNRENCWASIGLHPHEAQHYAGQKAKLDQFSALITTKKVIAVGECGLDLFYTHSPREDQVEVLKFQFELAVKYDLPMIFHVREAFEDFWPIFDSFTGVRGVLHSFTDNAGNLAKAIDRGLYIGVNGIATFAKNPEQLDVYKAIPKASLLLETDSPFLTPTPYRGSINEPKRLGAVADFVANLRGEDRSELASTTTGNAHKLFGI